MSGPVRFEQHGAIALIVIDNPPVNALAQPVRAGLLDAIVRADNDEGSAAIVVHGEGRNFIAGADIRELANPPQAPLLNDVLLRLEACSKPVIAAFHGMTLGGGFELALASHYRCATRDVQMGLPEIKLGLLPGSGGTQRLPRAVGVRAALEMMLSGEPIRIARARQLGLVDHVLEGDDLIGAALSYARTLVTGRAAPRRLRDIEIPDLASASVEFFCAFRRSLSRSLRGLELAAELIVRCVEAAVAQPFDAALALSRRYFEECRQSPQSFALRHLFFAERSARRLAAAPQPIGHVCVVGAGTMGSGIAVSCATSGLRVTLIDTQPQALTAGMARVGATLEAAVKRGRLTSEAAAAAEALIGGSPEFVAAAEADLVIEAVFESMMVKREVFATLDSICRPGTVLATNTSTLDVDAIAQATGRPDRVLGMHFFSPANIMKLVEIVRAARTSEQTLATALAVAKRMGKLGVIVGNGFGFVGNRMLYAYGQQNQLMMLEGSSPERIDAALEAWGMAMGPNAVGDLAGLDVGYRVRRERQESCADPRYFRVSDLLVERGRHGRKTGAGFYRYDPVTQARLADPEVVDLIRAEAARLRIPQRELTDGQIVQRCIGALIEEGERVLAEGIAVCADDIDVIWCNGYGFPRTRGGPMFYARAMRGPEESACN